MGGGVGVDHKSVYMCIYIYISLSLSLSLITLLKPNPKDQPKLQSEQRATGNLVLKAQS